MRRNIPQPIVDACRKTLSMFDGKIQLIGSYQGKEVYVIDFDEPVDIGLPVVYLWDGNKVKIAYDDSALEILLSIRKSF